MKIAVMMGAVLLGATGLAAAPAEAQRYGWNDRHDGGRYHDSYRRDWRGDRNWRGDRGWRGDRRWNRGPGWNRGYGWGRDRSRIVCRTYRSYYGPERRCFRVWR